MDECQNCILLALDIEGLVQEIERLRDQPADREEDNPYQYDLFEEDPYA